MNAFIALEINQKLTIILEVFIKEKLLNLCFNEGIIKHAKKQENMSIETVHEKVHMLYLLDKDHKLDILELNNMFKELNKTI